MFDGDRLSLTLPTAQTIDLAPWHRGREHLVANALAEAQQVAPHLSGLAQRWLRWMPRRPMASQSIRSSCRDPSSGPLLLHDAVTCPWMAVNTPAGLNAICLDVDHDDVLDHRDEMIALGAPVPDIMLDPWSGRAHAVLWLATPVRTDEAARPKPRETADYAGRLLAAALGATILPQAALVKSPWGRVSHLIGTRLFRGSRPNVPARWAAYEAAQKGGSDLMWITIPGSGRAELRDVIRSLAPRYEFDAVPQKTRTKFRKNRGLPDGRGRNCELFDLVRWWAYDTATTSTEDIQAEADRINGAGIFAAPLPASEVRATARSIARFMRERYRPRHGSDARRGRDRDLADLDPQARQAAAGKRTAADRAAATDARISAAVADLQASGRPLTQAAIAARAGVCVNTVASRWRLPSYPQNAVLSGGAAVAAGSPSSNKNPSSASLAEMADRDRGIRSAVASLAAVAAAALCPGSVVPDLPAVPPSVAAYPEVKSARQAAEAAIADARRRARARVDREATAARSAEMRIRVQDPAAGWRWFREMLADLDAEWDAREAGAAPRELSYVRARRDAVVLGRWRSWKAALRRHRPEPPDKAIPS